MENVTCGRCTQVNPIGEDECENCGLPLPRPARRGGLGNSPAAPADRDIASLDGEDPFTIGQEIALVRFPDGRTVSLHRGDRLVVGRTPESPLADLCSDNISFHHAEIYVDGQAAVVVDTRSTNGTFVNGQRLAPSVPRIVNGTAGLRFASDPPLHITIELPEAP